MSKKAFIHIPRTGGTSYRYSLRRYGFVQELDVGILPREDKSFYIGHFPYGYIDDCAYFTILRNPLDRVISEISYFGIEYLNLATEKMYADFDNAQIRYLTNMNVGGSTEIERLVNQQDFELACSNLDRCRYGFFENHKQTFNAFQEFSMIRLESITHQNKTRHLTLVSTDLDRIVKNNEWDFRLYEYAMENS